MLMKFLDFLILYRTCIMTDQLTCSYESPTYGRQARLGCHITRASDLMHKLTPTPLQAIITTDLHFHFKLHSPQWYPFLLNANPLHMEATSSYSTTHNIRNTNFSRHILKEYKKGHTVHSMHTLSHFLKLPTCPP